MSKDSAHMVLHCLLRRQVTGDPAARFLLIRKRGQFTFPPTKLRQGEDLYRALVRPMDEDLGLPSGSYYLEQELAMSPSAGQGLRYPGLPKQWHLYPVRISVAQAAQDQLNRLELEHHWWTVPEILQQCPEPNVLAIAQHLQQHRPSLLGNVLSGPSLDALACQWAAGHDGGIRVVRGEAIRRILSAGSRALNLRVADPYLPYQKQGLGFTWSFSTPKGKQDVHVHGMPAVEIYGVIEGRLQLWHKPMNQRGVRTWRCQTLRQAWWTHKTPVARSAIRSPLGSGPSGSAPCMAR